MGQYRGLKAIGVLVLVDQHTVKTAADTVARLFVGAALFGLGWGLVGYCPGPALLSAAAGIGAAWWFCLAMAAGMLAWRRLEQGLGLDGAAGTAKG